MSFFLYRPHVRNDAGTVITPDILVERVRCNGKVLGPERLTAAPGMLAAADGVRPATAWVAFGEGTIVTEALVCTERGVVTAIALAREARQDAGTDVEPGEVVVALR